MQDSTNIDVYTNTVEEKLVLLLARNIIHDNNPSEIADLLFGEHLNWGNFKNLLLYHQLSPLAYHYIKEYAPSLTYRDTESLKRSYYSCVAYVSYLWREFINIAHLFNAKGIEFLPLKGISFIIDNIYTEALYLRPMSDIDLLIKRETLPLAEMLLEELGYDKDLEGLREEYWKNRNYHLAFKKKDRGDSVSSCVEIHWGLDYKRRVSILPDLWNRMRRLNIEEKGFLMLSPEDTIFSLSLHQRRFGRTVCLKDICDMALVFKKYSADLDWEYIIIEAKRGKMRTSLYFLFCQTSLLLGIEFPHLILKGLDIPNYKKKMLERFILQSVFPHLSRSEDHNIVRKKNYLKNHFLLYDNFREPIGYILNIPLEQFAKFYGLLPYAKNTRFFYKIRCLYIFKTFFEIIIKEVIKKLSKFFRPY